MERFGIHAFLVSNTVTNDYYPTLARTLFELCVEIKEKLGIKISFINLSGGVGIAYKPDQVPNDIRVIGAGVQKRSTPFSFKSLYPSKSCSFVNPYFASPGLSMIPLLNVYTPPGL